MLESERFKKIQKNRKCFAYIGIFIVFQIIVMTVFGLTVMKIKTPSVRLRSVTVQTLESTSNTSFTATLIAEVTVKNKNFGSYRFDATKANVTYGDVTLGSGDIIKSRAGLKKTKRLNVTIDVNSSGVSDNSLATELTSGNVTLTALSRVTGKVSLMGMMKKRKTANMNCSMIVNVPNKVVYDLTCK
ncbi:putative Late embryogenesis abundant protein, LEA-14 [Rosa chinensis]|uniref:Putative Late embryogenesis abundant protein, LEA-14 n=1 Tax=Rosa chinensis TaxID=74649 RepID=A0A2P6P6P6_ROSCH|nr:late embryogenesis abundant protein At1g64065 [Rosa chinensis]PRQ17572.1 putative Late embryogenesis abundant protein, LEA-14 [Rosa chinensis]